jgi:5-hydroxyisourate hydrolase-like protein (transthyretin family)
MTGTRSDRSRRTAALAALVVAALVVVPAAAPIATAQSGETATITVLVTTERETPIPNATVIATWDGGETQGTTAGNGRVFIDVPRGATVSFDVDHSAYTRNNPLRRTIGPDTDEVTVEVSEAVRFTYRVTGAGTDVSVLDDRDREVAGGETGADGRYRTPRLAAGDYTVRFERTGYFTVNRSERGTQSVTRPITLERGLVTLAVNVTDSRTGTPLEGATVRAADESGETDADGRVDLDVPVNDEVQVSTSLEGYGDATRSLAVGEADRTVAVSVARLPNLTASAANDRVVVGESTLVSVRDAYDDPAANVTVLVDGEAVGETDADGELLVTVESAGDHEIRARRGNTRSPAVVVEGVATGDAGSATATPGTSTGAVRTPSSGLAPGFGVGAALAALLLLGYAVRSPRR